ncbi:DUF262 domain-containing protein [Streptomyces sp. NPDC005374]|uniref:DUF262 domain-containing protein n=1 Tax=Streptomyces sp. NPDC005374 TaxID=3364713 RepID=UPI0036B90DC4
MRNLHERSGQIADLLDELLDEADRCPLFVDWLLSKVVMVGIRAPSRDSGFHIFESMNDRGARLTPVDLIKSYLLTSARRDEEKLNEHWRHMLAELTSVRSDMDAPRTFLKAALPARYARVGPEAPAGTRDTTPDGRRLSLRELRNEAQQDGRLTGARAT